MALTTWPYFRDEDATVVCKFVECLLIADEISGYLTRIGCSFQEEADTGVEGSKITDGDKEAIELDNSEKIPEKVCSDFFYLVWKPSSITS